MLTGTKNLVLSCFLMSASQVITHSAISMEMPNSIGERTFDKIQEGEIFIKGNDKRIFLISDIHNAANYATYPTDQGKNLTVQEVPGDGRCGDYALGISREEFKNRIKEALTRNDKLVQEFTLFVPVLTDLDGYNSLEVESIPNHNAHENNIRSTMQLASYLFKLNLEIYYPDYNSLGAEISYGTFPSNFKPINRLKLHFNAMYGAPQAPIIRVLHMGQLVGFKQTGISHYRYLFEKKGLEPWEKRKVELLELATKTKYDMTGTLRHGDKAPYESICEQIIPIQAKAMVGGGEKIHTRLDDRRTSSATSASSLSPSKDVGLAVATVSTFVQMGADDEAMIRELKNSGFDSSIFAEAIEWAKFELNIDKYAQELAITKAELLNNAQAVSMSPIAYYNMMK